MCTLTVVLHYKVTFRLDTGYQTSFHIVNNFILILFLRILSSLCLFEYRPVISSQYFVKDSGGYLNVPSSSSVGATARCGLWPVEKYLSICPYLSPDLSIFSLPALEDLFLLLLSILSWVFLFVSSLPVLE
jgi:hypothetical protein